MPSKLSMHLSAVLDQSQNTQNLARLMVQWLNFVLEAFIFKEKKTNNNNNNNKNFSLSIIKLDPGQNFAIPTSICSCSLCKGCNSTPLDKSVHFNSFAISRSLSFSTVIATFPGYWWFPSLHWKLPQFPMECLQAGTGNSFILLQTQNVFPISSSLRSVPFDLAGWSVSRWTPGTCFQVLQNLYQDLNKLKRGISRSNLYPQGRQYREVLWRKASLVYPYVPWLQEKNFLEWQWLLVQTQQKVFLCLSAAPSLLTT